MTYAFLFYEFFKTGLFAVGGGLATLPFLYDIAERYDWFDSAMLADMVAVAESTPGPIGVNTATYAGYSAAGVLGAFTATFALVLPSFIVILLVTKLLTNFSEDPRVKAAFYGIRPAVTAMIAAAGLSIVKVALLKSQEFSGLEEFIAALHIPAIVLFAVIFVLYAKYKKHPVFYILAGAVAGVIFKL